MGFSNGTPTIVTDGLVFAVDAGNGQSYVSGSSDTLNLVGSQTGSLENDTGFSNNNQGSWVFDGVNDYIDTSYIPPTALYSSGFSLSAWINPSSTTDETIIGQYSVGNRFYWRLYGSFYWVGFGSWNDWTTISSSVQTGVWQSVVLTYNPSDTTIRIYLDGVLDDSMVKNLSSFGVPDLSLNIGTANATGYFSGNIANFKIYNKALSAAEILQNYNATKGRFI